jgi:hypothetical protein
MPAPSAAPVGDDGGVRRVHKNARDSAYLAPDTSPDALVDGDSHVAAALPGTVAEDGPVSLAQPAGPPPAAHAPGARARWATTTASSAPVPTPAPVLDLGGALSSDSVAASAGGPPPPSVTTPVTATMLLNTLDRHRRALQAVSATVAQRDAGWASDLEGLHAELTRVSQRVWWSGAAVGALSAATLVLAAAALGVAARNG